jgi:hypothetical protein
MRKCEYAEHDPVTEVGPLALERARRSCSSGPSRSGRCAADTKSAARDGLPRPNASPRAVRQRGAKILSAFAQPWASMAAYSATVTVFEREDTQVDELQFPQAVERYMTSGASTGTLRSFRQTESMIGITVSPGDATDVKKKRPQRPKECNWYPVERRGKLHPQPPGLDFSRSPDCDADSRLLSAAAGRSTRQRRGG